MSTILTPDGEIGKIPDLRKLRPIPGRENEVVTALLGDSLVKPESKPERETMRDSHGRSSPRFHDIF